MNQKLLNAYELLELDENATINDIKRAYHAKAKQYHPDLYFEKQEKKIAEAHFKKIKEAYDSLLSQEIDKKWTAQTQTETTVEASNEQFSDFFQDDYDYFYYEQEQEDKFATLQKKAIDTIEKEIKLRKIHKLQVYDLIKNNKIILHWKPGQISSELLYDYLVKEDLYRHSIKNSSEYLGYIKNEAFFQHLDQYATITINPRLYRKKKFEERVYYSVQTICKYCDGLKCQYCNYQGVVTKEHSINIKLPLNNDYSNKYYEIDNGGNQSKIINGKLILTVKYDQKAKLPYQIDFKKYPYEKFVSAMDGFNHLKNWISNHKALTISYIIILLLIITIICLAVLL